MHVNHFMCYCSVSSMFLLSFGFNVCWDSYIYRLSNLFSHFEGCYADSELGLLTKYDDKSVS